MNPRARFWLIFAALSGIAIWAYWLTLSEMAERWTYDPQYSHGYLVPVFALVLLWLRQRDIRDLQLAPSWEGVIVLVAASLLWAVGTLFYLDFFSGMAFVLTIAALMLAMGGWTALRWSWQPILFLAFMAPLPFRVQNALGGSLQSVATKISTFALQTVGIGAISEGNVILVGDVKIGIVEACSGLGMLVTFFALATGLVFVYRSMETWLKWLIVISAAPVAVLANVIRITITGYLYSIAKNDWAKIVFHDIAGWLMMPLAIGILFAEIHVLKKLIIERPTESLPKAAADYLMAGKRKKNPKKSVAR